MNEARELFPMVWLGNDKPVPDQTSVKDFRPQVTPSQESAVPVRPVDDVPKASSATLVAESSVDGSPESLSGSTGKDVDAARVQTGQVSPTGDLEAMMIGNS